MSRLVRLVFFRLFLALSEYINDLQSPPYCLSTLFVIFFYDLAPSFWLVIGAWTAGDNLVRRGATVCCEVQQKCSLKVLYAYV